MTWKPLARLRRACDFTFSASLLFLTTFGGAIIAPAIEAALPRSTNSPHHGKHPPHALGSRGLASTSADVINYPSSDLVSVFVPDHTEYVRGAATDKIIAEALEIAARQPFAFPPRTQW